MGIGDACYGLLGGLVGSQVDPGLERKSDPSPLGTCRVLG